MQPYVLTICDASCKTLVLKNECVAPITCFGDPGSKTESTFSVTAATQSPTK